MKPEDANALPAMPATTREQVLRYIPDLRSHPDLVTPGLINQLLAALNDQDIPDLAQLLATDYGYGDPLLYWLLRRDSALVERFLQQHAESLDMGLTCFFGLEQRAADLLATEPGVVNYRTAHGWALLDIAAHQGHSALTALLLKHGAARQPSRALFRAAQNGFDAVVHLILQGVEHSTDELGMALARAVHRNRLAVVELLLDYGVSGAGLLGSAAVGGRVEGKVRILEKLLAHGAEIDERDAQGYSALYSQISFYGAGPDRTITEFLLQHGAQVDIFAASGLGLLDHLQALLAQNPALARSRTPDGRTPLHFAARGNQLAAAQVLVAAGADKNAVDRDEIPRRPIDQVPTSGFQFVTCDTSPMRDFLAST